MLTRITKYNYDKITQIVSCNHLYNSISFNFFFSVLANSQKNKLNAKRLLRCGPSMYD